MGWLGEPSSVNFYFNCFSEVKSDCDVSWYGWHEGKGYKLQRILNIYINYANYVKGVEQNTVELIQLRG